MDLPQKNQTIRQSATYLGNTKCQKQSYKVEIWRKAYIIIKASKNVKNDLKSKCMDNWNCYFVWIIDNFSVIVFCPFISYQRTKSFLYEKPQKNEMYTKNFFNKSLLNSIVILLNIFSLNHAIALA